MRPNVKMRIVKEEVVLIRTQNTDMSKKLIMVNKKLLISATLLINLPQHKNSQFCRDHSLSRSRFHSIYLSQLIQTSKTIAKLAQSISWQPKFSLYRKIGSISSAIEVSTVLLIKSRLSGPSKIFSQINALGILQSRLGDAHSFVNQLPRYLP